MVPGETIESDDLAFLPGGRHSDGDSSAEGTVLTLQKAREQFERGYIVEALVTQRGNISRTADVLGVERSNLYRKMRAFGIITPRKSRGVVATSFGRDLSRAPDSG